MASEQEMHEFLRKAKERTLTKADQKKALESAASHYYYSPEHDFDDIGKKMIVDELLPYVQSGQLLVLGYTKDIWIRPLLGKAEHIEIIEGATDHVRQALKDFDKEPKISIVQALFEDYEPKKIYDTILMSGVVKHIPDDLEFLKKVRKWLRPGGTVIGCTPNSKSFHRRLGAYMGLEVSPDRPNTMDEKVFNIHTYDRYRWRALFMDAGFKVEKVRGIFFKILSTEQLIYLGQKYDVNRLMDGLRDLGEELQDYAWYIMLVARNP